MSGHAVLTSCHTCGTSDEELQVVGITKDGECGESGHHVHVFVACPACKTTWRK